VSRFNEEQIIDVLRQHEAGARIAASTQRLDRAINASRTLPSNGVDRTSLDCGTYRCLASNGDGAPEDSRPRSHLSFFWCGLGQIYNGEILKGVALMNAAAAP